jgi:nicotinate dehydrogenase subunit B
MTAATSTRRDFTKALGGLVITFSLAPQATLGQAAPPNLPPSLIANRRLDSWIRLSGDGTVAISTGKVEYGQGILTALMQIVAEELDVKMDRMRILTADTSRSPNEGYTFGSLSIEHSGAALRQAAAEARAIILDAASQHLKVSVEQLSVEDGRIQSNAGSVTYWTLVQDEALLRRDVTATTRVKSPSQYTIVGRPLQRIDIPAKVTGGAAFVQDLRLPGMVFGRVVRPQGYHADLISVDERRARELAGILAIVRDGNFLGVVAEREEQAIKARELLIDDARWRNTPASPLPQDLPARFMATPTQDTVVAEKNAVERAPANKSLEATYTRPPQAHAAIGPSCAVASLRDGKMSVWSHTQAPYPLRKDLAGALGVDEKDVVVIHMEGAGCYGHNGADDAALDAALLARAVGGRPVKLQWMRDDEFAWEPYGSAMAMRAQASLDNMGRIVDWQYEVWSNTHAMRPGQQGGNNLLAAWHMRDSRQPTKPAAIPQRFGGGGDRNAIPLYDFPRQKIVDHLVPDMPLRVSSLRTLGGYSNVFAIESFMDELAFAVGIDPVQFRLNHLRDERGRSVVEAAAKAASWKPGAKSERNVGRGFGFARYKNTSCYVAAVVDAEVNQATGVVAVRHVVAAVDSGQIVNPDGLRNQIEGGILQAISWTLKERVAYESDKVTSRDWSGYPILTFPEVPTIDVVLLDRPAEHAVGAGEASLGPTAAAVSNAIYQATGRRLRDLPFHPDRVKGL